MWTRIIKTVQLSSGAKVMHLKQANNKVIVVRFCEPIRNPKQ